MAVADAGQWCRAVGDWIGLVVNGLCIFSVFPHSGNSQATNLSLVTQFVPASAIALGLLAIDGRILQLLARLRRG